MKRERNSTTCHKENKNTSLHVRSRSVCSCCFTRQGTVVRSLGRYLDAHDDEPLGCVTMKMVELSRSEKSRRGAMMMMTTMNGDGEADVPMEEAASPLAESEANQVMDHQLNFVDSLLRGKVSYTTAWTPLAPITATSCRINSLTKNLDRL